MVEMCESYTTTGFPIFKPKCLKNFKASLKCHSKRESCPGYEPSEEKGDWKRALREVEGKL